MSRNKSVYLWIVLSFLLLAGVAAIVPAIRNPVLGWLHGEAFFDGQPASVWSERLSSDVTAKGSDPGIERLRNGGKAALPVLMAIAFNDSGPRIQAQDLLVVQGEPAVAPLIKVLQKSTPEQRGQAALVLGAMGSKAKPAVDALVRLLDDDDELVREAGMKALEQIGPQAAEAVPDLTLILEGKGRIATGPWLLQAVRVLGKIGPSARTAVPALAACLDHRHIWLVRETCLVLGGLGPDAALAVPKLIEVLKNREPACDAAAVALGKIGPSAKLAVPALIATLVNNTRPDLRDACKTALAKMGAEARPAVPALLAAYGKTAPIEDIGPAAVPELIKLLLTPEAADQGTVRFFLQKLRKQAVPVLIETLHNSENVRLRATVATLLGPSWGEANRLLPALVRTLEDKDNRVREAARNSVIGFRKEAQPFLEQQLRGKNAAQGREAIQLLGRLGSEARSSARVLLAVLKEEDRTLHAATVYALGRMDYHPKEAMPILIQALKRRQQLEVTLPLVAAHGRGARDAIPILCRLLQDADGKIRSEAAQALGKIGVDKDIVLPALTKAFQDKDESVRARSAQALTSARLLKDDVVPILIKLLSDPSEQVQGAALVALGQFGAAARPAVPLIHKIARMTPEGSDGRAKCITALGGIGPAAQEAAPLLLSWLAASTSAETKLVLIDALGRMETKEAAKLIEPFMQPGQGEPAAAAALALWRIQRSPAVLAFLHEGLKDKAACTAYIRALGQVGPAAGKSVPALIDILLRNPDLGRRALAAEALGRLGPVQARPALKTLIDSLRVPDARLRAAAARALAPFDEDARDASSRLLDLLNDPESAAVRAAAADALLRIDPDAAADAGI